MSHQALLSRSCSRSVVMENPQSSQGMSTRTTVMIKSGAAMPAAVNRITAAISPATVKRRVERQYLARLMRPLAPNRNSNRSSMIPLHVNAPGGRRRYALLRNGLRFKADGTIGLKKINQAPYLHPDLAAAGLSVGLAKQYAGGRKVFLMSIQVYGFWRSIASFRVRVALRLKGLSFEEIPIDILSGEQFKPGYAAVN